MVSTVRFKIQIALASLITVSLFVIMMVMFIAFSNQIVETITEKFTVFSSGEHISIVKAISNDLQQDIFSFSVKIILIVAVSAALVLTLVNRAYASHSQSVDQAIRKIDDVLKGYESGHFRKRVTLDENEGSEHDLGILADRVNELGNRLKYMEQQIKEHHKSEMENAERLASVGELAASMAHEIRNPVAGISNAIQVLSSEMEPENENGFIYDEIINQTQRVNRAINNLLSYARPDAPELVAEDINQIIRRSLVLMEGQIKSGMIKLEKYLDNDIPEVMIDTRQIQQVVVNLILNAVQAMEPGGTLKLSTSRKNDEILLSVADNGKGIPEDVMQTIFDPFFSTKPKGTGLGLAISRSIIEKHSGRLNVSSEAGKGSTFEICLPVKPTSQLRGN